MNKKITIVIILVLILILTPVLYLTSQTKEKEESKSEEVREEVVAEDNKKEAVEETEEVTEEMEEAVEETKEETKEEWVKVKTSTKDVILPFEVVEVKESYIKVKIEGEKEEEIIKMVERIVEDIVRLNKGYKTNNLIVEVVDKFLYNYNNKTIKITQ